MQAPKNDVNIPIEGSTKESNWPFDSFADPFSALEKTMVFLPCKDMNDPMKRFYYKTTKGSKLWKQLVDLKVINE